VKRAVKWALVSIGALVLMLGAAAAYIAATFDPNDYKSAIVNAVREKTGRTLQLKGDIGLAFYPTLAMKLGEATLSERNSNREFAHVADAKVAVKLLPLLSREVIVDAIEVKGLRATITRTKSGQYNFDDLTSAESKKPGPTPDAPLKVDIDHVAIADGDVTYTDEATGDRYELTKLVLKTGRVANGVTTPVDFSALIASTKHKAQLDTNLKAKLTFDLDRGTYKFDGLDFSSKGTFDTLTALNATAKGDAEMRLQSGELIARTLTATLAAKQQSGDLKAKLDMPALTLTKEKIAGEKMLLEVSRDNGSEKVSLKVALGGVTGRFDALKAGPLDVNVETQGQRAVKAHLTGNLTGNVGAKRFEMPEMKLEATVQTPGFAKGASKLVLIGFARADLERESVALDLSGTVDESKLTAKTGITKFSPLSLTFDVDADQLDLDRLLAADSKAGQTPVGSERERQGKSAAPVGKDEKVDLSALEGLNATGTLKIGRLTVAKIRSSQVRAEIKASHGRLDVAPLSARLYDGTLAGSLTATASTSTFAAKQTLSGISVGALLRDAANIDTLEAKGNVNVDLTTRGATIDALKKALNGTAGVNLADGAIKGIDIAGAIRGARAKLRELRGEQVQQTNKQLRTDFSELKATFRVKDGVAHNEDLTMKSPLLRVAGAGDIDIGHDKMNYVLKATVVATSTGQGGKELAELKGLTVPVKLTGALESPQYSIDFASMATDFAKRELQEELLGRVTGRSADGKQQSKAARPEDLIKDRLKGILGR
jgi:AsmA protein